MPEEEMNKSLVVMQLCEEIRKLEAQLTMVNHIVEKPFAITRDGKLYWPSEALSEPLGASIVESLEQDLEGLKAVLDDLICSPEEPDVPEDPIDEGEEDDE